MIDEEGQQALAKAQELLALATDNGLVRADDVAVFRHSLFGKEAVYSEHEIRASGRVFAARATLGIAPYLFEDTEISPEGGKSFLDTVLRYFARKAAKEAKTFAQPGETLIGITDYVRLEFEGLPFAGASVIAVAALELVFATTEAVTVAEAA